MCTVDICIPILAPEMKAYSKSQELRPDAILQQALGHAKVNAAILVHAASRPASIAPC